MKPLFVLMLLFLGLQLSFGQKNDSLRFESEYEDIMQMLKGTRDSVNHLIYSLEKELQLNDIEKAKINYLKISIEYLYDIESNKNLAQYPVIDSTHYGSVLEKAKSYLIQTRPNIAIPMLLKYLKDVDQHSDSAVLARIYLAEGYRKIGEFQKGIDIINKLLNENISLNNRAYACNRIAALYAECGTYMVPHRYDSVFKYSNLCIKISKENNFIDHLATSQNELAYFYMLKKKYQVALGYGKAAYDNFIKTEMMPQALQTSTNIAETYMEMGKPYQAKKILKQSIELGDINEYQSLFFKIYLLLASIHHDLGDMDNAYEYLRIARTMQVKLYNAKIRANIYDMAAKYEAEKKEHEIVLLKKDNEIRLLQIAAKNKAILFLALGIFVIAASFILISVQFRKKKRAYDDLVNRNLEIVKSEKEFGLLSKLNKKRNIEDDTISNNEQSLQLLRKLDNYMSEEKPYLYSDISLDDISHKLNTNRSYLSKLINEHHHQNFNAFINEYRIRTARQLLAEPANNYLSIEGIGQMSGFNSKSTFFTCFKKNTGITPSYFRDSITKGKV